MHERSQQLNRTREKMLKQFRQICNDRLQCQAGIHINNFIKSNNQIEIDMSLVQINDIAYIEILLTLPIKKIYLGLTLQNQNKLNSDKIFHTYSESKHLKALLRIVSSSLSHKQSANILILDGFILPKKGLRQLLEGINSNIKLKQLTLKRCNLVDQHMQILTNSLINSKSLIILNLSHNYLNQIGNKVSELLSAHIKIRQQIDLKSSQNNNKQFNKYIKLYQINLSYNLIKNNSAIEIINSLRNNHQIKCINLRGNQIQISAVKQFATLLKNNSSLISLDLRDNPGFTKQYSQYIYHKLLYNMQKYEKKKKNEQINQQTINNKIKLEGEICIGNKHINGKKLNNISSKVIKNNSSYSQYKHKQVNNTSLKQEQNSIHQFLGNVGDQNILRNSISPQKARQRKLNKKIKQSNNCLECKHKEYKLLKLQKYNLELQLQLRRIKESLAKHNIDINNIIPFNGHFNNPSIVVGSHSRHYMSINSMNNDDESILQRMEQMMMQLTKIMQTIEVHPNTQSNISNNGIQIGSSMQNTIPLYARPSQLLELENQIGEEEYQSNNHNHTHDDHKNDKIIDEEIRKQYCCNQNI